MSVPPSILLIDSDPLAAMTIGHSFKRHAIRHPLIHAFDTQAAILYLRHHCPVTPCLILLDTEGPGKTWAHTLAYLQAEGERAQIPVLAMGRGSQDQLDTLRQYPGVTDALIKEPDYAALAEQIGHTVKYWTELKLKAAAA